MRINGRKLYRSIIGALLIVVITTMSALAHHPEISATAECQENGTFAVLIELVSWNPGELNGVNNDVRVYKKVGTGSWVEIGNGAFNADNEYGFQVNDIVAGDIDVTVKYRAVAVPKWGPGEDLADTNQTRETTLELPEEPCNMVVTIPCGIANIDGNVTEWSGAQYVADMYRAGKSSMKVESKFYAVYDAHNSIFYGMVRTEDGVGVTIPSNNDPYFKVNGTKMVGDETGDDDVAPDFQWWSRGFEASIPLAQGTWTLNVHMNVDDGGKQTSAFAGRAITIIIDCPDIPPAKVKIRKLVTNNDSGTLVAEDFHFYINGMNAEAGIWYEVPAGIYTLTEQVVPGYTPSNWSGACDADGKLDAKAGQEYECTITNDDIEDEGDLIIRKKVDFDGDGVPDEEDTPGSGWTFTVSNGVITHTLTTTTTGVVSIHVKFGNWTVCEVEQPDWLLTNGAQCRNVEVTSKLGVVELLFLNHPTKGTAVVVKIHDKNKSGGPPQDGEDPIEGVTIILYRELEEIARAITNALGEVRFENLLEGDYHACEIVPDGWLPVNYCVDLKVEGGKVVTDYINNFKPPTAIEGEWPQPGQQGLWLPFASN